MDYEHPKYWTEEKHYGQCGQSCPCCRAAVGDTFGACPICIIKFTESIQMVNHIDNKCDQVCCKRKRKITKNNENNSKKQKK